MTASPASDIFSADFQPTGISEGEPQPVSPQQETKAPEDGIAPVLAAEKPPPRPPSPDGQPRRKIAILGTTPSRAYAPLNDLEWEIWTIGPGGKDAHSWDVLFEVHHIWPENFKEYLNDLSLVKEPMSVIMLDDPHILIRRWADMHAGGDEGKKQELLASITGDWATTKILQPSRMIENFHRAMWFSSSISYCIGAAIERDPTDIGFFGIDLESGEEYISQYTGAAHLIDVARHHGINILYPPCDSGLNRDLAPYPDRYQTNLALTLEKKFNWLTQAAQHAENEFKGVEANYYRQDGAIMAMRSMQAPQADIDKAVEQLNNLHGHLLALGANRNHLNGELSAVQYTRRMFIWGVVDSEKTPYS